MCRDRRQTSRNLPLLISSGQLRKPTDYEPLIEAVRNSRTQLFINFMTRSQRDLHTSPDCTNEQTNNSMGTLLSANPYSSDSTNGAIPSLALTAILCFTMCSVRDITSSSTTPVPYIDFFAIIPYQLLSAAGPRAGCESTLSTKEEVNQGTIP